MAEHLDDFVAGWTSGVAGLALTQPIDDFQHIAPPAANLCAVRPVRIELTRRF